MESHLSFPWESSQRASPPTVRGRVVDSRPGPRQALAALPYKGITNQMPRKSDRQRRSSGPTDPVGDQQGNFARRRCVAVDSPLKIGLGVGRKSLLRDACGKAGWRYVGSGACLFTHRSNPGRMTEPSCYVVCALTTSMRLHHWGGNRSRNLIRKQK